jgi:predicted RecA/RadA family phage recombinase
MTKNYVQPGNVITLAAPAALKSGEGFVVGNTFAVAATDAGSGADVEGHVVGVWELDKATGAGIDQGDRVWWDVSAGECVASAGTGNCPIGTCTETAGTNATGVRVRLDGVATTVA